MFNFGGGMLTKAEIEKQIKKGNIGISPYDPSCINPNSINLKLHPQLLVYRRDVNHDDKLIDLVDLSVMSKVIAKNLSNVRNIRNIQDGDEHNPTAIKMHSEQGFETLAYGVKTINSLPVIDSFSHKPLDMKKENETIEMTIPEEGLVLYPGVLYIGRTVERTWTNKFIPMINGRSSGGRLGISIHICAGFGDIGFDGTWTLEITVVEPIRIYPNTEIAQVCFFKPCGKILTKDLYRGRYFGQEDATASRFHLKKHIY